MLSVVLADLRQLQQTGLWWNWSFLREEYADLEVTLRFPIFQVRGDTAGHDKLCCLRKGSNNPVCRVCQCKFDMMDRPGDSTPTTMAYLRNLATGDINA